MTLVEQVMDAVRRDCGATVMSLLAGRTEKERAAVARAVKEYVRAPTFHVDGLNTAFALAVLGSVSRATGVSRELDWAGLSDVSVSMAVEVLTDRNPTWLSDLPTALPTALLGMRHGDEWWRLVRELVRQGAVAAPDDPNYTLHMAHSLGRQTVDPREPSLAKQLPDDPALLEDEVLRLFRVEGAGPLLHGHDYWAVKRGLADEDLWATCLTGSLPRQKAIDLALSALRQDWPPHHVTWYVDFHRRLQPTAEEMTSRQDTYRALLSASAGRAVKLAQDALRRLLAEQLLDIHAFLDVADAPLHHREMSVAMAQVALLRAVTGAVPTRAPACARAVVAGLMHPHQAVQQAAAEAVLAMKVDSDPRVVAEVRACLPALGGRAADILLPVFAQSERGSTVPFVEVPGPRSTPLTVRPTELARLDPDMIEPALVHLLEEADDPLLVEQVLDFVARHADRRPTSEALLDRAKALQSRRIGVYRGTDLCADLAQLVASWMIGQEPEEWIRLDRVPHFDGRTFGSLADENAPAILHLGTIVSSRLRELAVVAAHGRPRTLLATPTYTNATISAADLRARLDELAGAGHDLLPMDLETAVLRAGPAVMSELLANQPSADVGLVRAATDMTRTPAWQRLTGPPGGTSNPVQPLARYDRCPPVVVWRNTSAPNGSAERIIPSLLGLQDPLSRAGYRWDDSDPLYSRRPHQMVACWPLIAPHHLDMVMAQAHPMLCRNVWEVRDGAVPLIQSLATVTVPPGEPTWSALSLALSGKNPTLRTAAVDAVVGLVSTNLLDGAALGRVSAHHAADKMIVVQRLLRSLEEAANVDAACTWRVLDVLAALLPGLVGHRDLGRALLLTDELAQRCGRTLELPHEPRVSPAAAKTIQRLVQRTPTGTTTRAEAARLLTETAH
ncbi:DUF6493 family protein [Actinopolymorpha pittospori]|uniref:HEAT repeat-containing protein n=1 Tax=Actinopolymorpha pittospori TaxID=648752 RepID=A0A927MXZ9_9ACTN|nr:DUF6493 family protein [Actinopolymorpha pittospori]MBE1608576.1 hypothetical protein [Actinopolymorpha pittospori]